MKFIQKELNDLIEKELDRLKSIKVKAGDVYIQTRDMSTRAGYTHKSGSLLYVIADTREQPHGELGPNGVNWVCKTAYGIGTWATLEGCIERGLLKYVRNVGLKWRPMF